MKTSKFNIIVPVYRKLVLFEKVSIGALFRNIKHDYPIYFIVPADSDEIKSSLLEFLNDELGVKININFYIKEYNKRWFETKSTYSSLLLTSEFYKEWLEMGYDKSFIYQTDCYLFRDEFEEWSNKPYTFVGAPIIATNSDWGYFGGYVGNGGFSMRDNYTLSNILNRNNIVWKNHKDELENTKLEKNNTERYIDYEDIFICRLLSRFTYVAIPSAKEASKFAFDRNPSECSKMYGIETPMCAHNFMLLYDYWKHYIKEFDENIQLVNDAEDICENWRNMFHPEETGKQSYADD